MANETSDFLESIKTKSVRVELNSEVTSFCFLSFFKSLYIYIFMECLYINCLYLLMYVCSGEKILSLKY